MGLLNEREKEYCRLRASGVEPKQAYGAAGYSLSVGCLPQVLKKKEEKPEIKRCISRIKTGLAKHGDTSPATLVKVEAAEVHKEVMARPSARKMDKEAIEQNLTDLHAQAVSVGDLGTARQCLVDLGKEKGMFTPVQKIRFETVDDLNLDDTEALIRKLMAAKEAESTPVVPDEEPASAELVQ